jgi:anti-sigma B factor antagonist
MSSHFVRFRPVQQCAGARMGAYVSCDGMQGSVHWEAGKRSVLGEDMDCGSALGQSAYFQFAWRDDNDGITFVLSGELDRAMAPVLAQCLDIVASRQPLAVSFDASALTFCDVAGARALLRAQRFCNANGIEVRVAGLRFSVRRLFDLMGVSEPIADIV